MNSISKAITGAALMIVGCKGLINLWNCFVAVANGSEAEYIFGNAFNIFGMIMGSIITIAGFVLALSSMFNNKE